MELAEASVVWNLNGSAEAPDWGRKVSFMDSPLNDRLYQAKRNLHQRYDELNQAWKEAEALLVSLNVGREVAVHMFDDDPDEFGYDPPEDRPEWQKEGHPDSYPWGHYLAFLREDKAWRIFYLSMPGSDWHCRELNPHQLKPILECNKEERLYAAKHLPDLLASVAEEAEKLADEVDEATKLLKSSVTPPKK